MIPQTLEELKPLRQWVNYIRIWNETKNGGAGGYDKPPINPQTLRDAMTNNPKTWADYDTAAAQIGKESKHRDTKHPDENGNVPTIRAKVEGVGLILAGGYCGIDFDHVIDEAGNVAPFATDIIKRLDTYTEISPSGSGLHALLYCGDLLEDGEGFGAQFLLDAAENVITDEAAKVYELEVYAPKNGGRYFTVTGNVYHDRPVRRNKSETLLDIFTEYGTKRQEARAAKVAPSVGTQYETAGRAASAEDNKTMLSSALPFIDPGALDFNEWASVMTALRVAGFQLHEAETWSSGLLSGSINPKNDPQANARRWEKFHFKGGYTSAAGTIINKAKAAGWDPSQAFSDEERAEYGRSLYTEEQRREYGRKLHEEETASAAEDFADDEDNAQKEPTASEKPPSVGTLEDDRREKWEKQRISAAEWAKSGYYAVILYAVDGVPMDDHTKHRQQIVAGYEEYTAARDAIHAEKWYIGGQKFQTEAEYFPGLVTYDAAEKVFSEADDSYLDIKGFQKLSKIAKIQTHDTVALAADTGAGKSSLMLNFIEGLNDEYPVLYFNLEMDVKTIFRRLVAIHTGITLDTIEDYKNSERTQDIVKNALCALTSRKPLQIIDDVYNVEDIEQLIAKSTKGRTEPTIVIIDHSLLVTTKKRTSGRYERFTHISEELRRISRKHNIVMFSLLQQNRAGKADEETRPTNSSLKESGSWENDSTHIVFLWWDPSIKRKRIVITKNRGGESGGDVVLEYRKKSQIYYEAEPDEQEAAAPERKTKRTTRDKRRDKLIQANEEAIIKTNGKPTLHDIAEAAGVTVSTVKGWIKEYGGFTIDGKQIDPAGIDEKVEHTGFIRLTPHEEDEAEENFK